MLRPPNKNCGRKNICRASKMMTITAATSTATPAALDFVPLRPIPADTVRFCAAPVSDSCLPKKWRSPAASVNHIQTQFVRKVRRKCRSFGVFATAGADSGAGFLSDNSGLRSPTTPLSDVVWPAAGAFMAMGIMEAIDRLIAAQGLRLTIAPFGAVCAVLFAAPTTPAAQKYNMFVSHLGCAATGVIALAIFGPGWIARSFALAASLAFMIYTGSLHPPAAGLPLLFIDGPAFHRLKWWYVLFPGAAGCILLCFMQEAVNLLKKKYKF